MGEKHTAPANLFAGAVAVWNPMVSVTLATIERRSLSFTPGGTALRSKCMQTRAIARVQAEP
jgi:hypothetical protein